MSDLLEMSEKLHDFLSGPDFCAGKDADIPNDVWIPFSKAVHKAREEEGGVPEGLIMPGIGISLMTERCHECLRRRGGCQIAYGSDECKVICDKMLPEKRQNEH